MCEVLCVCRCGCHTMCGCAYPATRRTWRSCGAPFWQHTMHCCPPAAPAPSTSAMMAKTPASASGQSSIPPYPLPSHPPFLTSSPLFPPDPRPPPHFSPSPPPPSPPKCNTQCLSPAIPSPSPVLAPMNLSLSCLSDCTTTPNTFMIAAMQSGMPTDSLT